jgi:hypothetical protein
VLPASIVARLDVLATAAVPADERSAALAALLTAVRAEPMHALRVAHELTHRLLSDELADLSDDELRAALVELMDLEQPT